MVVDRSAGDQSDVKEAAGFAVVSKFVYLGWLITNVGVVLTRSKRRTAVIRTVTTKFKKGLEIRYCNQNH